MNKYNNKKTELAGMSFASKGEAGLFLHLQILERGGLIKAIQCQDHVYLTNARILYVADFKVLDLETELFCWHEFKGFETDVWRIKRRLWKHYGPGPLSIWKASKLGPVLQEVIVPV